MVHDDIMCSYNIVQVRDKSEIQASVRSWCGRYIWSDTPLTWKKLYKQ